MRTTFYSLAKVFCVSFPVLLQAQELGYPVDFSDFFEMQRKEVLVHLVGDAAGMKVIADAAYDRFILPSSYIPSFKRYLVEKGVSDKAIPSIINALTKGEFSNADCKVSFADCKPTVGPEDIKYVFDYYNNNLGILVGSNMLTRVDNENVSYHPAYRSSNAFVNQARLYSYAGKDDNGGLTASNLTTLGLPYGHILLNTQLQTSSGDFSVFKGVYDLEVDGFRAVAGYSERDRVLFNSSDFLNDDAEYTSYSLQVGSSRNLVRGGKESIQSIYLFAPQSGQLEIYQGERLLLTRVVSEGRHDIAYSDLPAGVYNVRIVLRSGGQVLLDEPRQVVNSQQFSLPTGEFDYVLTAGKFEDVPEQESLSWLHSPERFSRNYMQSRLSWRASDNLLLAGGITANKDDQYGQVGATYAWSDWLQASYMFGYFSSEDRYQLTKLTVGPVFLSMNRFDSDEDNRNYRLATQLYNEFAYRQFSASYSAPLWRGNSYVTYSHYESESPSFSRDLRASKTNDISAGWMTSFLGGQWSFDATYSTNDSYDDFRVGVIATYALDDSTTSNFSIATHNSGPSRAEQSLTKNMNHGDWSTSGTTSLALQSDSDVQTEATISGTVNGHTEWFNAGAYGYVGNTGRSMASVTLSGTQLISSEGVGFTNKTGSSFIHVKPEIAMGASSLHGSQADDISLNDVHYNVRQGARTIYYGALDTGDTFVPLAPYIDTEFVMDSDATGLHIENNVRREFVYPGTVYTVDAHVTPMISQLFVLNDINGKPVKNIRCVGDACSGVEPVSDDGVFRINYKAGGDYRLVSSDLLCIPESGVASMGAIKSYCLPGLMSDERRITVSLSEEHEDVASLIYVGKYQSKQDANAIISKLNVVGLTVQSIHAGGSLYLYVKSNNEISLAQRSVLEALDAYIVLNDTSVDKMMTVR